MRRKEETRENFQVMELRQKCEELRQIKEKLEKSEAMYRFFAENSVDAMWHLDNHFQFVYVSPAVQTILGYQVEEIVGRSLFSILTPESGSEVKGGYSQVAYLQELKQTWGNSTYTVEAIHKDGHHIWLEVTVNPIFSSDNRLMGYVGITRDISERRKNEEVIYHYAFYDSLTNLPNRRLFDAVLEEAVSRQVQFENSFAVLFLDIDGLKKVNDAYGHTAGDLLLQVVAKRFRHTVRHKDFVARLAGDEFTAILSGGGDSSVAGIIATRLIENCCRPIVIGAHRITIGVSIGVSFFPADTDNVANLVHYADQAMYRAKKLGGSRYNIYGDGSVVP
ncbi:MAG: diguanylate cyclase [Veillonellales bacterium]